MGRESLKPKFASWGKGDCGWTNRPQATALGLQLCAKLSDATVETSIFLTPLSTGYA